MVNVKCSRELKLIYTNKTSALPLDSSKIHSEFHSKWKKNQERKRRQNEDMRLHIENQSDCHCRLTGRRNGVRVSLSTLKLKGTWEYISRSVFN